MTAAVNFSVVSFSALPVLQNPDPSSIVYAALAVIASLLILEQTVYWQKKSHLPGPSWTIPIIGKFADSRNPTLENYQKSWDSGPLSAVSVFNM